MKYPDVNIIAAIPIIACNLLVIISKPELTLIFFGHAYDGM
jgi:hypothetical protein